MPTRDNAKRSNAPRPEVHGADLIARSHCEAISGMALAIVRLTDDVQIKAMAKHIAHLSEDMSSSVTWSCERCRTPRRASDRPTSQG